MSTNEGSTAMDKIRAIVLLDELYEADVLPKAEWLKARRFISDGKWKPKTR